MSIEPSGDSLESAKVIRMEDSNIDKKAYESISLLSWTRSVELAMTPNKQILKVMGRIS